MGYVCSSLIEKLGFSPRPQAKAKRPSLPLKIVRKGLRVVLVTPLAQIASAAGAGPSMEVVFRKALRS